MVYIHEGGFFAGTISPQMRGPQYFMDTSAVILVLMSYRLGVFGKLRQEKLSNFIHLFQKNVNLQDFYQLVMQRAPVISD